MSEMVDRLARELSAACFDGCEDAGEIGPCVDPPCACRAMARRLLAAMREPDERALSECVDAYGEAVQPGRTFWRDVIEEMLK